MMACREVLPEQAAALLRQNDRILLLCHRKPDGDTLGSGFALLYALQSLGKTVRIACSDGFPRRYAFFYPKFPAQQPEFAPAFVVAVDIADPQLLGDENACWAGRIDLCIDHHPSNTRYARGLLLDPRASSTTMLVARVLDCLGTPVQGLIASALYTGLVTDTGCFRYSNTTPEALELGARLARAGVDTFEINKRMFETKSAALMQLEREAMDTLEYAFEGRLAMIAVMLKARLAAGVPEEELEGLSQIPRQIEGVEAAATFKQTEERVFRVSLRTNARIDASKVCGRLGGGGHSRAAGCTLHGELLQVKRQIERAIQPWFSPAADI